METEPVFLTVDEVLELHDDQIETYGGDLGTRDMGLIESAVAMPAATFGGEFLHGDLFMMAAAYAFHIAESQAFVDGNKRTGLAAAGAFLKLNGYRLREANDRLANAILALATHDLDKQGLANVFREMSEKDNP